MIVGLVTVLCLVAGALGQNAGRAKLRVSIMERLVVLAVLVCLATTSLGQDMEPPQIFNCPTSDVIAPEVTFTSQASVVGWDTPFAFNLQPNGGFTNVYETANIYDQTAGTTLFNYGFTAVGYRFVDNPPTSPPQNNAYCTFFVVTGVTGDNTVPTVLNCPSDISTSVPSGQTTSFISWTEPSVSESVVRRVERSHAPNTLFPLGITNVRYSWIDASNAQTVSCSFSVTVSVQGTDSAVPSLTCPDSASVTIASNGVATWTTPTPTDSQGSIVSLTPTHTLRSVFNVGFTTVTYTATDSNGNRATCSFIVRRPALASDAVRPVITSCPENVLVLVANSSTSGSATWIEPTAYDNSGHVRLLMQTYSPNTLFNVSTTPVEYQFEDIQGNIARCVFNVVVTVAGGDTTAPVFSDCPTVPYVFTTQAGQTAAFVTWNEPQASDNMGVTSLTRIAGISPGSVQSVGDYSVTYRAQDAAGNFADCMFTVSVRQAAGDTTNPVFSDCPTVPYVFTTQAGQRVAFVTWNVPQTSDNVGVISLTQTAGISPNSVQSVGDYPVTYRAQDAAGNFADCVFTVSVRQAAGDTTNPVFSDCPTVPYVFTTQAGQRVAFVTWNEPQASDNVGVTSLTRIAGIAPNSVQSVGDYPVTYRAQDAAGNFADCVFTVSVRQGVDTTAPVFSDCTTVPYVFTTQAGQTVAFVSWNEPQASDNVGVTSLTRIAGISPGSVQSVGDYSVIYRAQDAAGNFADCVFTVSVRQENVLVIQCPDSAEIVASAPQQVTIIPPTATGNVGAVTYQYTVFSGGMQLQVINNMFTVNPGSQATVVAEGTDTVPKVTSCAYTVTVTLPAADTTPPTIFCPTVEDVIVNTANTTGAIVSWPIPTATDNTGDPTIALTPPTQSGPGSFFMFGAYNITYRATDAANNTADCYVTFSVVGGCLVTRDSSDLFEVVSGQMPVYLPGESVQFVCPAGYQFSGSANRFCQLNFTWTGEPAMCQLQGDDTVAGTAVGISVGVVVILVLVFVLVIFLKRRMKNRNANQQEGAQIHGVRKYESRIRRAGIDGPGQELPLDMLNRPPAQDPAKNEPAPDHDDDWPYLQPSSQSRIYQEVNRPPAPDPAPDPAADEPAPDHDDDRPYLQPSSQSMIYQEVV